ncbi:phage C1 repressor [Desulfovibrio sp. X2]|uniref:LexA family transcriptional regulator n=1 Tax=Desulfovibrio sp. X2 TaxID=941449 RepID=UPI00035899F0|nr:S24 family peptidase [Desulfovibrio sp. X2]EPR43639.1 phage C1 repressor [Desulfovibrio sp. X2]
MKGLFIEDILKRMMHVADCRNQAELASVLGVKRAAVTDAKRRGAVPADWYLRLCRLYGANPVWVETGLGSELLGDPEGEEAPAGFVLLPAAPATPRLEPQGLAGGAEEGRLAFSRDWLGEVARGAPEELRLLAVAGDAMAPTLRDGDTVLVDQGQREIVYGKIYALAMDDAVVVKRLDKKPGMLVLVSDNHAYPPLEIDMREAAEVRVLGRVVWLCRENP